MTLAYDRTAATAAPDALLSDCASALEAARLLEIRAQVIARPTLEA